MCRYKISVGYGEKMEDFKGNRKFQNGWLKILVDEKGLLGE